MSETVSPRNLTVVAAGAALGFAYGLAIRCGSRVFPNSQVFQVMTLSFMVVLPFAIGFITIFVIEWRGAQPIWMWFLFPWLPLAAGELATVAAFWEGFICVVMFTPIAMGASSLGGAAAGLIARYVQSRRLRNTTLVSVLCLPLLISSFEPRFLLHQDLRSVESVIDIQASPATVWRNIERVPRIRPAELQSSWSHTLGFPNPVEASLSEEGVGGIRHATFEVASSSSKPSTGGNRSDVSVFLSTQIASKFPRQRWTSMPRSGADSSTSSMASTSWKRSRTAGPASTW